MRHSYLPLLFALLFAQVQAQQPALKPWAPDTAEAKKYVHCFTSWLTPAEQDSLNAQLKRYEQQTGNWINVWVEISLNGDEPGPKSSLRYKQTMRAHKNQHNGVILSFFNSERKMALEAGLNLEDKLTKTRRHYIMDNVITPQLKQQQYHAAITAGINEVKRVLAGMPQPETAEIPKAETEQETESFAAGSESWLDRFLNWGGAPFVFFVGLALNFVAASYVFGRLRRAEGDGIQWLFLNLLMIAMVFIPLAGAAAMYGTGRLLTPRRGSGGGGGSYSSSSNDDDDDSDDSSTDDDNSSSSSYSSSSDSSSSSSDYSSSGSDYSSSDSSGSTSSW